MLALLAGLVALAPAPAAPAPGVAVDGVPAGAAEPVADAAEPGRALQAGEAEVRAVSDPADGALQARLGCDHKAVFTTTYLELTKTLRDALVADPRHACLAAGSSFARTRCSPTSTSAGAHAGSRGSEVPEAWRIAFETAEQGEVTGAQDMLLGINAHVQNDMPFVLAQLGLRDRKGRARKPDHDQTNQVLSAGYERVVARSGSRYDSSMALTNPAGLSVDDVAGLEIVREWREQVWRNAERLVNAKSDEERAAVAAEHPGQRGAAGPGDRGGADAGLSRDARRVLRPAAGRLNGALSVQSVCEHVFVSEDHDPNLKGNVAELKIAAEAARLGIDVLRPMTEHAATTSCSRSAASSKRVQCKSAPRKGRRGHGQVRAPIARGPNGYIRTKYTADEIDAIAAYCPELDRMFLPTDRSRRRRDTGFI